MYLREVVRGKRFIAFLCQDDWDECGQHCQLRVVFSMEPEGKAEEHPEECAPDISLCFTGLHCSAYQPGVCLVNLFISKIER